MNKQLRLPLPLSLLTLIIVLSFSGEIFAQDELKQLDGTWLFVEDRTEGRAEEMQGPPMSVQFELRVEEDAVIYPRPRGDERISLDGSTDEKENNNGSVTRYSGQWKDGVLSYTLETIRTADNSRALIIERKFQVTDEGLRVEVIFNEDSRQVAIYKHPEDIALPEPAKATIEDLKWMTGTWEGLRNKSTIGEQWTSSKGSAMLAVASTVKNGKLVAFEYLRIVERDGGLVYVAQPGGKAATEFVLTELAGTKAVFVNPRHDYPQRIVYELSDDGALTASIGFAKGRLQSYEFTANED